MERPNAWKTYSKTEIKKLEAVAKEYRQFIDNGKTERECVTQTIAALEKEGYTELGQAISLRKKLGAGDKVYLNKMGKAVLIFLSIIGYCNLWFAIFIDFAAAVATVLNTIRVTSESFRSKLRYKMGK